MNFKTSDSTESLDLQLAKAQGELKSPNQTKVNPFFKSKYADISDILSAIRPTLKKYDISLTQWPIANEDPKRAHVLTRIAFKGEFMLCEGSIPIAKGDAHGYASAVTYLKRISLGAVLGLSFEEDDDGNKSVTKPKEKQISSSNPDLFTFGQYKGKSLKEIPREKLVNYLAFMNKTGVKEGSPMAKMAVRMKEYLNG